MKMIYISCNVSTSDSIIKLLEENDVADYQVVEQVNAKNIIGAPRLNTPVWPGYNSVIFLQFSNNDKAYEVLAILKEYNKSQFNINEKITVCSWEMDEYFWE